MSLLKHFTVFESFLNTVQHIRSKSITRNYAIMKAIYRHVDNTSGESLAIGSSQRYRRQVQMA